MDSQSQEVTDINGLPAEILVLDEVGEKEMILYEDDRKIIL